MTLEPAAPFRAARSGADPAGRGLRGRRLDRHVKEAGVVTNYITWIFIGAVIGTLNTAIAFWGGAATWACVVLFLVPIICICALAIYVELITLAAP